MPRFQPGPTIQKRAWSLIKALVLAKVGSEAQTVVEGVKLQYLNWKPASKFAPQIKVEAKLTELSKLMKGRLNGEQLREIISLYLGQKFLGILEDKRRIKHGKGSENWHFILTLWDTDLEENQKKFNLAWERRKCGQTEESVSLDSLEPTQKLQENRADIDELVREVRSRCCDKILNLYSKIQLLNRQQIDIDKLYVDVYVLEKLASDSHATIPGLLRGSDLGNDFDRFGLGQRGKRSPGFEVAANYLRLMILGKPGSGKSTFLRHLAVACCKDKFLANHIPILIELRDINASDFNLLSYIHQEFDLSDEEQTLQILKQGKVLILLDGLDEVPSQSRREVQDHIYKFSQATKYYKNRFILTCRTQTTEYTLQTFEYIEVADFKPEQTKIFARNWFAALAETPEQGEELTAQFLKKLRLPENKQTAELAVTPILLSLTCWVFNDLKDLPAKRSNLYELGVNLLLQEWDEKRGIRRTAGSERYRNLSLSDKKKLLSYLAAHKFEQEQFVLFEEDEIQGCLTEYLDIANEESQEVLKAIEAQYGLLIERTQSIWSFSHLTFQEYFTAKWFCDRAARYGWNDLVSHITEKNWREVFLLTVEMLPNADSLLQLMKRKVDELVADDEILQRFLIWINNKSSSVNVTYKPVAIRFFYLFLSLDIHYATGLFDEFGWVPLVPPPMRHLDHNFDKVVDPDLALAFTLKLAHDIDQSYHTALAEFHDEEKAEFAVSKYTDTLKYALVREFEPEIKTAIEPLKEQLGYSLKEKEFMGWWQVNGQAWTKKLRDVLIQYHNFHEFNFNDTQKHLLQHYYDANKLLVDCLKSCCAVSPTVKQEIEDTLLWQEPSATEIVAEVADE